MKRHLRAGFLTFVGFVSSIALCEVAYTGGPTNVPSSCRSYSALNDKTRAALATGYLEGVQAAVDKETRDMLVPPEHQDHPIWWVLPKGEVTPDNLQTSLAEFCQSKAHEDKKLVEAFLTIAARTDGSPRIGIPFSDGPSDGWRRILGESRLTCSNYQSAGDTDRANLIYGYFLGTNAIKFILKTRPDLSLMVWPDADYRDVKVKVDAACRETRYIKSTIRNVLWTITAEMGMERRLAGAK